jgi:ribosomal protein S18 acetylase RimI-like enzyme
VPAEVRPAFDDPRRGFRAIQFNAVVETNRGAVALWRSLGFEVVGTVPEAFHHPSHGYVALLIMHRFV